MVVKKRGVLSQLFFIEEKEYERFLDHKDRLIGQKVALLEYFRKVSNCENYHLWRLVSFFGGIVEKNRGVVYQLTFNA